MPPRTRTTPGVENGEVRLMGPDGVLFTTQVGKQVAVVTQDGIDGTLRQIDRVDGTTTLVVDGYEFDIKTNQMKDFSRYRLADPATPWARRAMANKQLRLDRERMWSDQSMSLDQVTDLAQEILKCAQTIQAATEQMTTR